MNKLKKVTVTAPGKLMLMGEHAAVYGHPCLVTTVDYRLTLELERLDKPDFIMDVPDLNLNNYLKNWFDVGIGDIPKSAQFVETAVKKFFDKYMKKSKYFKNNPFGLKISAGSSFSGEFGFGSSSASTVCAVYALSSLFNIKLENIDIFRLAYETVLEIQGAASGFDVAAAVYGGTLYYENFGKKIEPIALDQLPLIVAYSGMKADTKKIIQEVKEKKNKYPDKVGRIFQGISDLVSQGKKAINESDWSRLGTLFNFNQDYLRDLGVSTSKLEDMIIAAKKSGAYGAKLSGAGGGDCIIVVSPSEKVTLVSKAIENAGGVIVNTFFNTPGVNIENSGNMMTSDDQKELFVVVDENDNILGHRFRHECHHDKNLIHRAVGVAVFNKKGQVLMQKRSTTKDSHPGFWTMSSSGHVGIGETYDQAARRELKEELGINADVTLGRKFIYRDNFETEINMVYRAYHEGPFNPDKKEVEEVKFFSKEELLNKINNKLISITPGGLQGLKVVGFL